MRSSARIFGLLGLLIALNSTLAGSGVEAGQQQKSGPEFSSKKSPKPAKVEPKEYTLVGAGDIAWCGDLLGAEATAKLIEQIPGTVFAAGDLAYNNGTWEEFQNCYQPTWGKFKDRTRPAAGNHEYNGTGASGYFRYWGEVAGNPEKGYYSYELGTWHIVVLNTNCSVKALGGCDKGSPEEVWLRKDLEAHVGSCIIAYGHHSLFSSGFLPSHAMHPELRAFWSDLFNAHADLVLAGHEHSYERFAPQTPDGQLDEKNGIRQIIVGTGGKSHTPLGFATANSEVRNSDTFGVLRLTLSEKSYKWEFIPQSGMSFTDSGEGVCHNRSVDPIQ